KLISNARLGAEWRETRAIKDLEPKTEATIFNWTQFWKKLRATKGVHCTTKRSSARRSALIKCMIEKLPTLEELNKRRPDIYMTTECQVCQDKVKETQTHLASCKRQTSLWKRIQKVTIATVWKGLKEEERTRIPPYVLYTALFGKVEAEEVEMREALIKGLIPKKTQDRLAQLLSSKTRQQFANTVAKTAWDIFYKQVWRIRCEKVNKWEKKEGITSKMKWRDTKKKNPNKKGKANQQMIEEEKRQAKEKKERIKEEARKTMLELVMGGGRPFHYGL